MNISKLTIPRLRAWLEERSDQVVGNSYDNRTCPLACYLNETLDRNVAVATHVRDLVNHDHALLPRWARRFITEVDESGPKREVTGRDCLIYLHRSLP